NLRHLIVRHSFELRHSDFIIVLIFLGNPSFVSGQGWMARKRKRRKGETAIRGGRCLFAHSPILRFSDSPVRRLSVTAEDAESGEASVLPWTELLLWALPSEKESYREYSV